MNERGFTGVFIPASLYTDPGFSWAEKILLIEVVALDAYEGRCWAKNEHFANHLHVSISRVSELINKLVDDGYFELVFDKPESGRTQRVIRPTEACRGLFVPRPPGEHPPSECRRSDLRNIEGQPSESRRLNNIKDNNISLSHASEREALADLRERAIEAAGDALADPASCPGVAIIAPLAYLLNDRPNAPACTVDELIDGVIFAARYMQSRYGAGSMKSWDLAVKKALELRDLRINGHAVKPSKAPIIGGPGDLATIGAETWRGFVLMSNATGGKWEPRWGPPPGAQGSFVPADLVELWKGKVDA